MPIFLIALLAVLAVALWSPLRRRLPSSTTDAPGRAHRAWRRNSRSANQIRCQRKPPWVATRIDHLAARQPDDGCRRIADTFNRLYTADTGVSVCKSHVADLMRRHHHAIPNARRKLKNRTPPDPPHNHVWALDLTGKADEHGTIHDILGLLEHRSRRRLQLTRLRTKATSAILRHVLEAVDVFGAPRIIRTDNEAIFTSRLFRMTLAVLGIRHQRTERHAPWQNGRIERLFGTLKYALDHWIVPDRPGLDASLAAFRAFYNHVRPHQSLAGRTPREAWHGIDPFARARRAVPYIEWDGLLTGYYFPD